MVRTLRAWERRNRATLELVLQVGDFEPHRHAEDLATMAAPARYRALGDFPRFASGAERFDWPVWCIGGNHEPYGWLERLEPGAQLAPNCAWIGRAARLRLGGMRVAGLSGVHVEGRERVPRPPPERFGTTSNKAWIHFTEDDVEGLLGGGDPVDVLIVHDWPEGVIAPEDRHLFTQARRASRPVAVGNPYARLLVDLLKPALVLCGHLHQPYRSVVTHPCGARTQICALDHVRAGDGAIAVFARHSDGRLEEVTHGGRMP